MSPVSDPKPISSNGSRDPLLLFQDLATSSGGIGGSLSRRNPPPRILNSPPSRSVVDPSFFSTPYPIDGRRSAEPFGSIFLPSTKSSSDLSSCLEALDLQNLDLRNIDPALAAEVLQEIRKGAELKPLLEKILLAEKSRQSKRPQSLATAATTVTSTVTSTATLRPKETKMVTFKDETDVTDAKTGDAFI